MLNSGNTVCNYRELVDLITLHVNVFVECRRIPDNQKGQFFCPLFQLLLSTNFDPHAIGHARLFFLSSFFGFFNVTASCHCIALKCSAAYLADLIAKLILIAQHVSLISVYNSSISRAKKSKSSPERGLFPNVASKACRRL